MGVPGYSGFISNWVFRWKGLLLFFFVFALGGGGGESEGLAQSVGGSLLGGGGLGTWSTGTLKHELLNPNHQLGCTAGLQVGAPKYK